MSNMSLQPIQFLLNTITDDGLLPSFFELHIFDEIDGAIKPAVKHILQSISNSIYNSIDDDIVASSLLRRLQLDTVSILENHFDAIYTVVLLMINYPSIIGNDASIVELLGGYKRVNIKENDSNVVIEPLSIEQKYISIAVSVLIPSLIDYLKKIQFRYQRESITNDEDDPASNTLMGCCKAFITKIPRRLGQLTCAIYDTSVVIQKMLYLMNKSKHSHPLLSLVGVSLVKRSTDKANDTATKTGGNSSLMKDYRVIAFIGILLAIRVTRWVYTSEGNGSNSTEYIRKALQKIPQFPSPPVDKKTFEPQMCPICEGTRVRSTASIAGYVFCHDCIVQYVRVNRCCPVSGLPCNEDDLIVIIP